MSISSSVISPPFARLGCSETGFAAVCLAVSAAAGAAENKQPVWQNKTIHVSRNFMP
jgi:hypothetical protein